jgi:thiol-disulfide isomerase/thioredoxin
MNQLNTTLESSYLSKMTKTISSLNSATWMIIFSIILFIIISTTYYFYYVVPKMSENYKPNYEQMPEGSGNNGNGSELLFFYADWCPHCKTAKPIWNDLKSEYENKTINGNKVTFTEINCSEETVEVEKMMNQYNVEGYPTIKLIKDGQVIEYDAKPSTETLKQFLNTVM